MSLEQTIVALDQMDLEEIDAFLSRPENTLSRVKIGLELFVKYGPNLVHKIYREHKKKIFLDLKLHDIPVTVQRAVHSLENLPIDFLTVHIGGGEAMLKAAVAEARKSIPGCKILGVSFLTSLEGSDLQTLYGITDTESAFLRLFKTAAASGIDGVVCSPLEIELVKKNYPGLLAVTPGIRFESEIRENRTQDQKRIATPAQAFANGSDFIVIGRSLTKASDLQGRLKELATA
jgi:orotidine-5'-phosphate decarboxylase